MMGISSSKSKDAFKTFHSVLKSEFEIITKLHTLKQSEIEYNLSGLEHQSKAYQKHLKAINNREEADRKKHKSDREPLDYKTHSKSIIEEKSRYITECINEQKKVKNLLKDLHGKFKTDIIEQMNRLLNEYSEGKRAYSTEKAKMEKSQKQYEAICKKYKAKYAQYSKKKNDVNAQQKLKSEFNNLHSQKKELESSYLTAVKSHNTALNAFYVMKMRDYVNTLVKLHLEYCNILAQYIETIIIHFGTSAENSAKCLAELDEIVRQLQSPDQSTMKLLQKYMPNAKYRQDYVTPTLMNKTDMVTGESIAPKYVVSVRSIAAQNVYTNPQGYIELGRESPASIVSQNQQQLQICGNQENQVTLDRESQPSSPIPPDTNPKFEEIKESKTEEDSVNDAETNHLALVPIN